LKVAVGLSGGVDSSVAAYLMKKAGHEVFGLTMKNSPDILAVNNGKSSCIGEDNREIEKDIRLIADKLSIDYSILDLTDGFESVVLKYFKEEYKAGRTPNPCVVCNCKIKFDLLLEKALSSGLIFDKFATGHYAKVDYNSDRGRFVLKKAEFIEKDQTYFLSFLKQNQLAKLIFPLGIFTKTEVRQIAAEIGLHTHDKVESQDFYSGDYKDLLDIESKVGPIKHINGKILGTHNGYFNYTIGQRKGLGVSYSEPLFVVAIDPDTNTVFVGEESSLFGSTMTINKFNWVSIDNPKEPFEAMVRIRYRHKEVPAFVTPLGNDSVLIEFREAQKSITPGQVGAVYIGDELIGGGFIEI